MSQLVIKAFEGLPLVTSFVKAGVIKIVIRRDPQTGRFWRGKYDLRKSSNIRTQLETSGPPELTAG